MKRLMLLGLNHTTAPLDVREKLAFAPSAQRAALARLRERFEGTEAVLLSTCNRVELYVSQSTHGKPSQEELLRFLGEVQQAGPDQFRSHVYHLAERDAVAHLFTVASSLDSMVLGETQILGQVRAAYDLARDAGSVGPDLNMLFQRAVAVGKQVMSETGLAEGRLSVASVAVDYAKRIFDHFSDKTVLCIGAGKMSQLVLRHMAELSPKQLLICNRDIGKADALARTFNGQSVGFDALSQHLAAADMVVTSTGSSQPIITRAGFEQVLKQRRYRPVFLIDIALPRDVEADVGQLENVYLYNLDDLQQVVSATQGKRTVAIEAARKMIAGAVDGFAEAHRARKLGPVIDQLSKRYHALAAEELTRTLNKLPNIGDAEKSHLEDLARRIVNKLLHDPIRTLRESDSLHHGTNAYLHAMEKLFHLGDDDKPTPANDTLKDKGEA